MYSCCTLTTSLTCRLCRPRFNPIPIYSLQSRVRTGRKKPTYTVLGSISYIYFKPLYMDLLVKKEKRKGPDGLKKLSKTHEAGL